MFKDDRMISFMTAIVLMIAVGTVIQKAGNGSDSDTDAQRPVSGVVRLADDKVTARAGETVRLDVFANDEGLLPIQRTGLNIVRAPDCGRINVLGDAVEYIAGEECVGERRIVYTVPEAGKGITATVFLSVIPVDPVAAPEALSVTAPAEKISSAVSEVPVELARKANETAPAVPTTPAQEPAQSEPFEDTQALTAARKVATLAPTSAPVPRAQPIIAATGSEPKVDADAIKANAPATDQLERVVPKKLVALDHSLPAGRDLTVQTGQNWNTRKFALSQPQDQIGAGALPASVERILVSVVEVSEPPTRHPAKPSGDLSQGPQDAPSIDGTSRLEDDTVGSIEVAALGDTAVSGLGQSLGGLPVDQSQAPLENTPAPAEAPAKQAALPSANRDCVTPPSTVIDVLRAARTRLSISAPCQANSVAELTFSGIRFAVPLDEEGQGEVSALGFEANAQALLQFADGTEVDFDMPFKNVDRVVRVALVWDSPVNLELNALEFGGALNGPMHVHRDNPREFSDVRRNGGGFLNSFRSVNGVGQNVEIYSHWKRAGGKQGIVQMMINFASRSRDRLPEACGDGPLAAPQFLVVRSMEGQVERPILRKLAALACSEVTQENSGKELILGGISDLLVR